MRPHLVRSNISNTRSPHRLIELSMDRVDHGRAASAATVTRAEVAGGENSADGAKRDDACMHASTTAQAACEHCSIDHSLAAVGHCLGLTPSTQTHGPNTAVCVLVSSSFVRRPSAYCCCRSRDGRDGGNQWSNVDVIASQRVGTRSVGRSVRSRWWSRVNEVFLSI